MRPALPLSAFSVRLTPTRPIDARGADDPEGLLIDGEAAERRGDYVTATSAYSAAALAEQGMSAAEARFRLGRVAWRQGRLDDALASYERACSLGEESGAPDTVAAAHVGIGSVHCERGDYASARASYTSARALTETPGILAKIALNLGVIAAIEGDAAVARASYEESAAHFRVAMDDDGLALALHNLGALHASSGEWADAETAYAQCLDVCERFGGAQMRATVLLRRAEMCCACDRLDEAIAVCEQALALFGDVGDDVGRADAFRWLGHAYRRRHDHESADVRLKDAARIAARLQLPLLEARACEELGLLHAARGDAGQAVGWFERAHSRFAALEMIEDVSRVAALLERHGGEARRGRAKAAARPR